MKDHATQLELDDANDRIDQLEWKLESREREMELQLSRVKERTQADHCKKLDAHNELIALLKEKLSQKGREGTEYQTRQLHLGEQVHPC